MNASAREETLFLAALPLDGAERAAFLDRECAGDPGLCARLEALLAAHDQPDTLFGTGADVPRPTISLDLARDLADDLVGQTIGRYKLLERIGEGGCGVVYVAEQTEPVRRRVALKVIKLGMDTKQVVARFEAERQALAMMDHPNIAKVLDAGTTEGGKSEVRSSKFEGSSKSEIQNQKSEIPPGRPYFVMELVRGIKITDYCDQERLATRERLDLFIKVCQAIQHAHQKGIIHRDIKPSNILVTLQDGVPVPKVIDFGIAKATEGRLTDATVYTQLHQFIGTPAYMSPEQAEMSGLDIDTRSDIYSLGVLLYELLTGTTPFDAKELMSQGIDAMRRTIREQEPPRPSTRLTLELAAVAAVGRVAPRAPLPGEDGFTGGARGATRPAWMAGEDGLSADSRRRLQELARQLRGDLDWIVMKCLDKDRGRRYETANGVAADLKRHLNSEPVVARPPSTAYRFRKAFRRNKLLFAAGTAVTIALVAGLGVSTWQWARAWRAEQAQRWLTKEAQTERDRASEAERQARRAAYLADMRLVDESTRSGNIGRARRVLAEHRPGPGQEDLRDWEWFYFERLARADDSEVLGSHPGGARHLLTSAGDRFVTGGQTQPPFNSGGQIQVWDETRQRLLAGFVAPEGTSAMALSRDGARLAVARGLDIEVRWLDASLSLVVRLTNWYRGTEYGRQHRHGVVGGELECGVNLVGFVANDTALVVARRSFENEPEHPHPLTFIHIASDATLPLVGGDAINPVLSLAVSDNGQWLAADTGDQEVILLRLPEREVLGRLAIRTGRLQPDAQSPMAFANHGRELLTVSETGVITLWDITAGRRVRTVGEHTARVLGLAVSPDGTRLASFGVDHLIRLWDLRATAAAPRVLHGHTDEIWGGGFVAGGRFLVSCGRDQTVRSWELREAGAREGSWSLPPGHTYAKLGAGVLMAVGRELRWTSWDVSGVGWTIEPRLVPSPRSFPEATVIPLLGSEYQLVVPESVEPAPGMGLRTVLLRGSDPSQPVSHFPEIRIRSAHALVYSQGTLFLHGVLQSRPQLLVWNVAAEETRHLVPTTTARFPTAIAVSPDASVVILGDWGGGLEAVEVASGRYESWPGALPHTVSALAILPDNRTVLAATRDLGVLRKLDWPNRQSVQEEVPGRLGSVVKMSLSPAGTRFATGDVQGRVRLWDVATLREVATLGAHSERVDDVWFLPDGRTLLSVDANELRVWRGRSE